jgi:hypothetical protein
LYATKARAYRPAGWAVSPRNTPWNIAFSEALKAEGYVDGQNLVIDVQGYGLRLDELADHAAAIVKAQVDVIICAGEPPIRAAQHATKTEPYGSGRGRLVWGILERRRVNTGNAIGLPSAFPAELQAEILEIETHKVHVESKLHAHTSPANLAGTISFLA